MKKSVWIAGATGLVGGEVLKQLSESGRYEIIDSIVRRKINTTLLRVKNHLVDYDKEGSFPDNEVVGDMYICLGTIMKKAGSKKAFHTVDFEYVLRIAKWAKESGAETCSVISSLGASPESSNFYLRTKGEMEEALKTVGFKRLLILRPSLLLGNRKEFRFAEKIVSFVMVLFSWLMIGPLKKYKAVKASQVAKAMLISSEKNMESLCILENKEILGVK